jgi:hypothetical protein
MRTVTRPTKRDVDSMLSDLHEIRRDAFSRNDVNTARLSDRIDTMLRSLVTSLEVDGWLDKSP